MPKIYRVMREEHGKPAVGPSSSKLGVRVPDDIPTDDAGLVHPGTEGMSVAPSLATLPERMLPKRFRKQGFPAARGNDSAFVWTMGEGPFVAGKVAPGLALRPDPEAPERHGFVEPERPVPLEQYETALSVTRDLWRIDETL